MNAQSLPYLYTDQSLIVFIDGDQKIIDRDAKNYNKVLQAIKDGDWNAVRDNIDIATNIVTYSNGSITVVDGVLHYDDTPLHSVLTDRILRMIDEGFDVTPMANFLINIKQNPSRQAVNELYQFMESGNLPITPDGYLLAYKAVNHDYLDYHTRKFDNSVGTVHYMPRNEVDDNRNNTCSYGFHFCSLSYARTFHRPGGHMMIVKINPADVVSIPVDYQFTKGRTCKYEVVAEYKLETDHGFGEFTEDAVYSFDDDEDEAEDEYDYEEDTRESEIADELTQSQVRVLRFLFNEPASAHRAGTNWNTMEILLSQDLVKYDSSGSVYRLTDLGDRVLDYCA